MRWLSLPKAIRIDPSDNVAVVLEPVVPGAHIDLDAPGLAVIASETIAFGHKVAVRDIARGERVIKYGDTIGRATKDIRCGSHVHVHNVESLRGRGDLA
jgi:altronate dehydratase small subunit